MGYKINRIMMRPGGVETQVRPPIQFEPIRDYYWNSSSYDNRGNESNFHGLAITPNVDCTLDKVKFVGDISGSGSLFIMDAGFGQVIYSDDLTLANTSGGEYSLTTPLQLTSGTRYNICVARSTYYYYKQANGTLTGTNVNFNGGLSYTTLFTNYIFNVRGVETTQTA